MNQRILCFTLLLAASAAVAQTNNEAIVLQHALEIVASRADNPAQGFCYLSVQHPEWPPMPASPDPSLEIIRIGPGEYIVNDAHWKYPVAPPAATNVIALKRIECDAGFELNTNWIAANPALSNHFRWMNAQMCATNNLRLAERVWSERRLQRMDAAVADILTHPVTNKLTLRPEQLRSYSNKDLTR